MGQLKNDELLNAMRRVLKELRANTSLSQDAVMTDIYDTKGNTINLARIETGDGNISPSTIFLLCDYYKINISDFFLRVEEANNKLRIK